MSALFSLEKLRSRLERAKVDADLYSIGAYAEGRLCLVRGGDGRWQTYFGERGEETDLVVWPNEDDAFFWFLGRLAWSEWRS